MDFVYENLPLTEWEELKQNYNLNEWGGSRSVLYCLRDRHNDILILNQGGQNRKEHPDEYAMIYNGEVILFDVYTEVVGANKNIRRKHILNLEMDGKFVGKKELIKECIRKALEVLNNEINERYLKLHPESVKKMLVEFVFEEEVLDGI
ncbi:MAG: hypothetical protein J6M66_07620 [Lachnospiraceae bacterium]|nr:hypothetical protein [Lachnospiraceae bacterium]